MVVVFGLDLKEMQWGKFKSSYMFGNTNYHLRRTKFVVYQIAMISCVVSESLGTAVLSDYIDQQKALKKMDHNAIVYNDDYIGVASFNIFVGIYVATVFGGAFFFDLFWPERKEDRGIRIAWRACSVFACLLSLSVVIAETCIVVLRSAYITGVSPSRAKHLLARYGGQPLKYGGNPRAIASLVFAWIGLPAVVASTILLWMSYSHDDKYGPFSSHGRPANQQSPVRADEETAEMKMEDVGSPNSNTRGQPDSGQLQNAYSEGQGLDSTSTKPVRVYEGT